MKRVVWKNKSNGQLCVTIPSQSNLKEGDIVDINKASIKRIAYSGVVGDLFHYGHLHSIQFAKSISDYNIIGIMTDEAVEEYRAKPIANLKERKAIISSLNCVDRVMVQYNRDPTENLKKIYEEFPNAQIILVHGSDLHYVHGSDYINKIGGKVVQHPYYERLSTFKIVTKIIENKDKFKDIADLASLIEGKKKIDFEYEKGNKVIVSSKANTLKVLKPLLKKSKIEEMFTFTVSDWRNKKQTILDSIKKKFSPNQIVVRSSAVSEDTFEKSMAGCFESILNVNPNNPGEIETAIRNVIASYKNKSSESSFNQVLVQSQTKGIVMSGVVFTRTLNNSAPYYVINYDDSSGASDTVTKGIENMTINVSRFCNLSEIPNNIKYIIEAVQEIETKIPKIGLDIEFAVNRKGHMIIFQARPLTTAQRGEANDDEVKSKIESLKNRFSELSKGKQHLGYGRTIFADMPDWNPAEIIGDNPHHLDYSLYDYLITDSAWHEARTSQGYYNVNPAKLVVLFGNKPYVNVRNTFNSFIPNSISQYLRERLVNFYLDKLEKSPELQDKVEFEIVYSCFDLSFEDRVSELLKSNFTKSDVSEIRRSLINLTNNLVLNSKKNIIEDLNSVKQMEKERERIRKDSKNEDISVKELLKNAKFLLDDCREKGTVQFSRLARLAFIGKIILKSLEKKGIITSSFYDGLMNSIRTVATEINEDFRLMSAGKISKDEFIKKYYHLRPGSYDITSLRYESNPDLLKNNHIESCEKLNKRFSLHKEVDDRINEVLKKDGLKFNARDLLEFIRESLEAREYSKFEFTKNLSDAIELIAIAGEKMGFARQELAHLDVETLFSHINVNRDKLTRIWKELIKQRSDERELNKRLILPPIIFSDKDFHIIYHYVPRPNFITQKKIKSALVKVSNEEEIADICGKVVIIESGDPGYDWIFTRNPAGLITKYGGVASHMSIRCAEFNIPAAIGCGFLYDQLLGANIVILDCYAKKITPLRGEL